MRRIGLWHWEGAKKMDNDSWSCLLMIFFHHLFPNLPWGCWFSLFINIKWLIWKWIFSVQNVAENLSLLKNYIDLIKIPVYYWYILLFAGNLWNWLVWRRELQQFYYHTISFLTLSHLFKIRLLEQFASYPINSFVDKWKMKRKCKYEQDITQISQTKTFKIRRTGY